MSRISQLILSFPLCWEAQACLWKLPGQPLVFAGDFVPITYYQDDRNQLRE